MGKHKCKALILDSDPDALITLQRTLEDGGVDTTITWDDAEARYLIRGTPFDVILIGDHPPEIRAETTVRDFRLDGALGPCLILQTTAQKMSAGRLQRLGGAAVVPKRDPGKVLKELEETCGLNKPSANAVAEAIAEQLIRCRAYELYEDRGREDSHDVEDWLRAEAEITSRAQSTAA